MNRWKGFIVAALFLAIIAALGFIGKDRLARLEKVQTELLVKLEAVEKNQEAIMKLFKSRQPDIDVNKVNNLPVNNSPVKGGKNAVVTIVEFSDFQCPYCSKLQPTLKEVLKAYPMDVKLVFKDFPLPFHQQAQNAARAAHAAGEQGKYWEMHDMIFENFNMLSEEKFKEFASKIGLDMKKFAADFSSNKYDRQIEEDKHLGESSGVRGTPTLFMNGKMMQRRSFNDFKEAIDTILKERSAGKK